MQRIVILLLCASAALAIAACSSNDSANNTMNVDENLTTTDLTSSFPDHNYDIREGDAYGYTAAVSEEDQKRGKAAGDVEMFKYAGVINGNYRLLMMADNGSISGTAECVQQCVVIKEHFTNGAIKRVGFTENSIIGAAFQDAFRGKLVNFHSSSTRAPARTYQGAGHVPPPRRGVGGASMNVDENLTTTDMNATETN